MLIDNLQIIDLNDTAETVKARRFKASRVILKVERTNASNKLSVGPATVNVYTKGHRPAEIITFTPKGEPVVRMESGEIVIFTGDCWHPNGNDYLFQ